MHVTFSCVRAWLTKRKKANIYYSENVKSLVALLLPFCLFFFCSWGLQPINNHVILLFGFCQGGGGILRQLKIKFCFFFHKRKKTLKQGGNEEKTFTREVPNIFLKLALASVWLQTCFEKMSEHLISKTHKEVV